MTATARPVRLAGTALAALALLPLSGCGGDTHASAGEHRTLTVLAASSLTETFTTFAHRFEATHPGVTVRLTFDSSATLAEQVTQGAPADVLATADQDTMHTVVAAHDADGTPKVFATNHLQMVVPPANPAHLRRFTDLDRKDVTYVVCVDTAPCGKLAATALDQAGIHHRPASEEVDVKAVLSKVELDEADAGLVYATDAVAAGTKVSPIDIPASGTNLTTYPIAALSGAGDAGLAHAWVRMVTSSSGQRVLAHAGFGAP